MDWSVAVICGAAGVGKSRLAAALADRHGVPVTASDDIVTALMAVTSGAVLPALHRWEDDPATHSWPPDRIAALHLAAAHELRAAFAAVVADHVAYRQRVVLEGDHLLPGLAGGPVRAVLLDEPDPAQLQANMVARGDPHTAARAAVSAAVASELRVLAAGCGVPIVAARPYADTLDRVERALRSHG